MQLLNNDYMNTNQKPQTTQPAIPHFDNEKIQDAIITGPATKADDTIIHDAKIITPQPYGVYALCKIFEKLQIN
jgi:hypothetical protein